MVTYRNGQVPATALTNVASGVQLLTATGSAYRALVTVAKFADVTVKPAPGVGSGYRSLAVQRLFYAAANGDKAAAQKVGLSSVSTVRVAAPGYSSHGTGNRIDMLLDGSDRPTADQLELASRYGFTREFGADDPNHFRHDGTTGIHGITDHDVARILGAWLNSRSLPGQKTDTQNSGTRGKFYWTRLQEAGRADGLYPTPYLIDGDPDRKDGRPSKTRQVEAHYAHLLGLA